MGPNSIVGAHHKLIQQLFAEHARALQVFFRRRIHERRDALDLTQEVYLRLLRAAEKRPIHNPEAYLFTVANNLMKERSVAQRRDAQRVELSDPVATSTLRAEAVEMRLDVDSDIDREIRAKSLRAVLPELPPRSRLALVLAFEEELSHQEIAHRLGISKTMVHKILTQAIAFCRKRIAEVEAV